MAGAVSAPAGGKKKKLEPNAYPNVIPFIDILLVLLIIFMVTAPIPTVDIRVDLPPPNPVNIPPPEGRHPTMILILASPSYQILVDNEPVTLSTLGEVALRHAIQNNPALDIGDMYEKAKMVVRADQSTQYRNVVDVMSRLQNEGFKEVGIFSENASAG